MKSKYFIKKQILNPLGCTERLEDDKLSISLSGRNATYPYVKDSQFRYIPENEAPQPIATDILLRPSTGGHRRIANLEIKNPFQLPDRDFYAFAHFFRTAFL